MKAYRLLITEKQAEILFDGLALYTADIVKPTEDREIAVDLSRVILYHLAPERSLPASVSDHPMAIMREYEPDDFK